MPVHSSRDQNEPVRVLVLADLGEFALFDPGAVYRPAAAKGMYTVVATVLCDTGLSIESA
jgi:hypothetical protein